jgi:coenzyme F420-reducing hydrogenase delta subunit
MGNMLEVMKRLGLEGRVHLERVSASEGPKFRDTVTEFVEQIRALDPEHNLIQTGNLTAEWRGGEISG